MFATGVTTIFYNDMVAIDETGLRSKSISIRLITQYRSSLRVGKAHDQDINELGCWIFIYCSFLQVILCVSSAKDFKKMSFFLYIIIIYSIIIVYIISGMYNAINLRIIDFIFIIKWVFFVSRCVYTCMMSISDVIQAAQHYRGDVI